MEEGRFEGAFGAVPQRQDPAPAVDHLPDDQGLLGLFVVVERDQAQVPEVEQETQEQKTGDCLTGSLRLIHAAPRTSLRHYLLNRRMSNPCALTGEGMPHSVHLLCEPPPSC